MNGLSRLLRPGASARAGCWERARGLVFAGRGRRGPPGAVVRRLAPAAALFYDDDYVYTDDVLLLLLLLLPLPSIVTQRARPCLILC